MFWDAAFNKSWLYISDEIVHEQFGYKKAKDMMRHFYEKLINEFEDVIDYKEVNKTHNLVKSHSLRFANGKLTGNRKKYYIITGETYKALLQSILFLKMHPI